MSNHAFQSTRGFNVIFIHSSLDDAGLTAQQFRVFAHLSRRAGDGSSWAAAASIAEVCRINEDTVWAALSELEARKMIRRESRPGKTTRWHVEPPAKWKLALSETRRKRGGGGNEGAAETRGRDVAETRGRDVAETRGRDVAETRGHEGNPSRESKEGDSAANAAKAPEPGKDDDLKAEHKAFMEGWHTSYAEAFGVDYVFQGAKDGAAVKRLLRSSKMDAEALLGIAAAAWKRPTLFNCKQAASIAGFASRFNEIRGELRNGKPKSNLSKAARTWGEPLESEAAA